MSDSANQGEREAWESWDSRASRCIAGGCLTFSKSRQYYVQAQPSHVQRGTGNHLIAHDGSIVFDTVSGLGANLCDCHNVYSLPSTKEVEFAEALLRRIPFERVKIVKTGTEACMAALRYMRAEKPDRSMCLSVGFHGWSHEFISAEQNTVGCEDAQVWKQASIKETISNVGEGCYAVIVEPVQLDVSTDRINELRELRNVCTATGTLLCFDEVITGMRFPQYTVAQTYGIMPDLMVLGKAIGGGHPLGLVLGPASIMDRHGVFVSGTFAGEESALDAGLATMGIAPSELRAFWDRANEFHKRLRYIVAGKMEAEGYGTRVVLYSKADDGLTVAKYMQEMYRRHKILIGPVLFPKLTWGALEYTKVLDATLDVMRTIDTVTLDGEKPRPVFKRNA
jgi:glutamate-1-semialdehyde aminotransferase